MTTKGTNPDTLVGGFIHASDHPGGVNVDTPRWDEMEPAAEPDDVDLVAVRSKRKGRSLKLAIMGIGKDKLERGDPAYKNAVLMAVAYRKRRSAELSEMHGHVSIGASALLASASLAMAASRHLYEKYAENGGGDMGTGMLKQAAQLADSARQSELAAWEMSAREGLAKRKRNALDQGVPWLAAADSGIKMGRKTNAERQAASNNSVIVENGVEVFLPDAGLQP